MAKRLPVALAALGLCAGLALPPGASAAELPSPPPAETSPYTIQIDDRAFSPPFESWTLEDQTLVPALPLARALGGEAFWDPGSGSLRAFRDSHVITLALGAAEMQADGRFLPLAVAPYLAEGQLIAPLRALAEGLGATVHFDPANRRVVALTRPGSGLPPVAAAPPQPKPALAGPNLEAVRAQYTPEEIRLLARLISAEAYGQPWEGLVGVGAVVRNRMREQGKSLREIIYAPGQFGPAISGKLESPDLPIDPDAERAALASLAGVDPTGGALYFYNPRTTRSPFFSKLRTLVDIGDHRFATRR